MPTPAEVLAEIRARIAQGGGDATQEELLRYQQAGRDEDAASSLSGTRRTFLGLPLANANKRDARIGQWYAKLKQNLHADIQGASQQNRLAGGVVAIEHAIIGGVAALFRFASFATHKLVVQPRLIDPLEQSYRAGGLNEQNTGLTKRQIRRYIARSNG
jgi:hypothetical protein